MRRVGLVVGPGQQHDTRRHEAREVVDVTVGLVVREPPGQPDHSLGGEMVVQRLLDLRPRQRRIAVGIQQALFRGDDGSLPVSVDRAALQHDRRSVAVGAFDLQDLLSHAFVAIPRRVEAAFQAPPRVETPVHAATAPVTIDDERRARVAHPRVVRGDLHHPHRRRESRAAVLEPRVRDRHGHRLARVYRLGHGGKRVLRRLSIEPPIVGPLRPGHPAAAVRLELAWHPVPVGSRRRGEGCTHRSASEA